MRFSATFPEATASFVRMSRRAGERFDLIQAGGGNTSVKHGDGTMLIKASGVQLSEVTENSGYSRVDLAAVLALLDDPTLAAIPDKRERDAVATKRLLACATDQGSRPSIETFLHAVLDRFTLHTHPLVVNIAACRSDWKETLAKAVGGDAVFVPYGTPGLELALLLKRAVDDAVRERGRKPQVLFLQNHGLITSGDDADEAGDATERVCAALEKAFGLDLERFKLTNRISLLVNDGGSGVVSYLSCDADLAALVKDHRQLLFTAPFCPDGMVYCGPTAVEIMSLDDRDPVTRYVEQYGEPPRVVLFGEKLFFTGASVRKAREAEEVCKFQLMTLAAAGSSACSLNAEELRYLGNWEAEQYRRKK